MANGDLILLLHWCTSASDGCSGGSGPAFVEGDYVHPLAAGSELLLPLKLREEIRFVVLGSNTANVNVPLLL